MPGDEFYGSKYKYILTGIDVASRFKVSRPLLTKKSKVGRAIEDIYKKEPLKWPKTVQVDNGSEFKKVVTKLFESHDVKIQRATTKYKHTHTAFVENFNKKLATFLFKAQDAQELNAPEKVATIWVKYLYNSVRKLNNSKTEMIGMKP